MSSWLARSIANSLRIDDEDVAAAEVPSDVAVLSGDQRETGLNSVVDDGLSESDDEEEDRGEGNINQGRGVKEDLSEFKDSLTRQFWGVASFLAPPPPPPPPPRVRGQVSVSASVCSDSKSDRAESEDEESVGYGMRESGQFCESANLTQSEDREMEYTLEDAVGITEEVLTFARNIAHHPETWLDFPLSEEEEFDDFDISDEQYKHVLAVEHLATRLAALRFELCPAHMSEGYFWMVYFVLLHSRLNKHDADLLSSPQIVQARAMWMEELHKQTKEETYWLGMSSLYSRDSADSPRENYIIHTCEEPAFENRSGRTSTFESAMHQMTPRYESEKHPYDEIEFIDKSVIKEDPLPKLQEKEMVVGSSIKLPVQGDNDTDDDDWLKEDSDLVGYTCTSTIVNEEDISFSDLEDDIDCSMPIKSKMVWTDWKTTSTTS